MFVPILALAFQPASAASNTIGCPNDTAPRCVTSVYFDSGEATTIRPEWLTALDALAATAGAHKRIRIDGFSDRSGPAGTNQRMSRARAASVAHALEERGVAAAAIRIAAHGERDTLVATPDGVREPQNRRVDVTVEP